MKNFKVSIYYINIIIKSGEIIETPKIKTPNQKPAPTPTKRKHLKGRGMHLHSGPLDGCLFCRDSCKFIN